MTTVINKVKLTAAQRSKINKANRAAGYRAEYDTKVKMVKKLGWWARRLPQRQQKGEMSPVDGYYWDPKRRIFGFYQAKVRYSLLTQLERDLLIALGEKYNCEILFAWRDNGIKFEVLKH